MSMRIACIHLPQISLQAALRSRPTLVGRAVVVLGNAGLGASPVVVACSRAAHAVGARLGMSGPAARDMANAADSQAGTGLIVLARDREDERSLVAAVADAIGALSSETRGSIERGIEAVGPHRALYCAVPSRSRGEAFGRRVREAMAAVGVKGRIGIADDRFTAWVAASGGHGMDESGGEDVVCVPRGGSAQFLAPRPLGLLAIPGEVQHMLATLGVRTLGQFAALPPPTAARAWDSDFQALARGDAGSVLRPSAADPSPLREEVELGQGLGLGGAIAMLAERTAVRLGARPTLSQALVTCVDGAGRQVQLAIDIPAASGPEILAERLTDGVRAAMGEEAVHDAAHGGVVFLRLLIEVDVDALAELAGDAHAAPRSAMVARGSQPVLAPAMATSPAEPSPVFQLQVQSTVQPQVQHMTAIARMPHRRTQRGKQRTRAGVAAQARLFGSND